MADEFRKARILAVEDRPEDVLLYRAVLGAAGYEVDEARTLAEARRSLREREYGVLLVALRMPDGDGLGIVSDAHRLHPHSETIVLTATRLVDDAVAAIQAHAYDFIYKPCPPDRLLAAVDRASEKVHLSRTLARRTEELETVNRELDGRVQDATREIFGLNEKLKRTVRDLQEASRTQARFLEDMAHEVKNPLAVVWGYASYLLKRPIEEWKPADLKRSLESIQRNAQHIQAMVEELLDSSRIDSHKVTLSRAHLAANGLVRELTEGLRPQAEDRGLTLEADCPAEDVQAFADENRLRQILLNLVINAIKFTPRGGRIVMRLASEDGGAHFCVEDTGRGLTQEQIQKIFERFYQADVPETRSGLGLGLHIVHGLVSLHEGRVWVESAPGKGSKFHFILPAQPTSQALRTLRN
ncbi:MAG: ATP-binding protein [Elusimicrobiota bacterium]